MKIKKINQHTTKTYIDIANFDYLVFRFKYLRNCERYNRQFNEEFCWRQWLRVKDYHRGLWEA